MNLTRLHFKVLAAAFDESTLFELLLPLNVGGPDFPFFEAHPPTGLEGTMAATLDLVEEGLIDLWCEAKKLGADEALDVIQNARLWRANSEAVRYAIIPTTAGEHAYEELTQPFGLAVEPLPSPGDS